jgi:ABC-type dipeptide/oligopeptide/nickel transport system ATPase component
VTTQARVLTLLADLQRDTGVAYLFISHDLGVMHEVSDRIAVLYRGRIVEIGDAHTVATNPTHLYTSKLQMAAPSVALRWTTSSCTAGCTGSLRYWPTRPGSAGIGSGIDGT